MSLVSQGTEFVYSYLMRLQYSTVELRYSSTHLKIKLNELRIIKPFFSMRYDKETQMSIIFRSTYIRKQDDKDNNINVSDLCKVRPLDDVAAVALSRISNIIPDLCSSNQCF